MVRRNPIFGGRSTRSRIMRLVIPLVMGVCLFVGLVLFFGIRNVSEQTLLEQHAVRRDALSRQLTAEIDDILDEVRRAGASRSTREFARDTLLNISGSSLEANQNRLLGDFTTLLDQNPNTYLAIRYVTFNGSVWSEVTNYDRLTPRADNSIRLNELANDSTVNQAFTARIGDVVVGSVEVMQNLAAVTDRQIPYIRMATPVSSDVEQSNIAGVIQFDVRAAPIIEAVRSAAVDLLDDQTGARVILVDERGRILVDTSTSGVPAERALAEGRAPQFADQYADLNAQINATTGDIRGASLNDLLYSAIPVRLGSTADRVWRFVLVENATAMLDRTLPAALALGTSLLLGALVCVAVNFALSRSLRSYDRVHRVARGVIGDGTIPTDVQGGAADDEVARLMNAFQTLGEQVNTLNTELRQQQERYNRSMDIAGRISRETAMLHDVDQLLNRAIDLICKEYNFYHAQVFLIDDTGENAILVYSYGEIGRQLLERKHQLAVGSESVIGSVTATGKPVIVNDTERKEPGSPHRFNPLLPDTRAEMALPLTMGDRVVGALDVQSKQPNRFQTDEIRMFQMMADQIAVAIENVRLLVQSEERVEQIDALNRQLTRTAWEQASADRALQHSYHYDLLNVERDRTISAAESGAVSVPITVRGEVIGSLEAAAPQDATFTDDDQVIMRAAADRVAIAIENARLFEEAQEQAQRALALAEAGQLAARIGLAFEEHIGEVFARVAQPANYDRWQLFLFDDKSERLVKVSEHVPGLDAIGGTRGAYDPVHDRLPITEAFGLDRMLLVNDPSAYPAFTGMSDETLGVYGKQLLTAIRLEGEPIGALMVGRSLQAPDLDESDEQLVSTLATQVAIAVENQRLFFAAEDERARLRSILDTLPAGVLVLDPVTYKPLQFNSEIETLLKQQIDEGAPFDVNHYHIYHSGTTIPYTAEEMPIFTAAQTGTLATSDDVTILDASGGETHLLVNAAPITDNQGKTTAIVAAFQDISALRSLEHTLEANLLETVALYETTRALSEAGEVEDVLDSVLEQLSIQQASDAYIVLLDERQGEIRVARSLNGETGAWQLPRGILNPSEALFVDNTVESGEIDEAMRTALLASDVQAFVSIPMGTSTRRSAPFGWIVLTYADAADFQPEREQFLTTLTDSVSVALDNRYLFRSTEVALQETAALYGATTSISRARSTEDIAQALQSALETLAPDLYAAFLNADGVLQPLFSVSLDDAPTAFVDMLQQHDLLHLPSTHIDDLRAVAEPSPFERDLLALGSVRALALVHLRAKDEPSGCFVIAYHTPKRFSSGDTRYLSAIADSASVVIDNFLLLNQFQNALAETSILYQASRALSDAVTTEDILNIAVSHLSNRPITQAFIVMLQSSEWTLPDSSAQIAASWQKDGTYAFDLKGTMLTAQQFPAWRLLASPDVVTIDDAQADAGLEAAERLGIGSLDLRSASIIPLRAAGRAIGALVVGSREPYTHSERDERIFRSFAEQASLRMEASRLLAQTERRARQLATSTEVSQIASSILDLNILLPRIVDLIRDAFRYDHVQIFMMDADDDFAELHASTGEAGQQLLAIRHKLARGSASVIGQVTETAKPVIASDTSDAGVVHRPNPYLPYTRSEMAVPLTLKGRVVGALDVQSNQPNAFDTDDVNVLTTLAGQIAVAIDNAQLFQQSGRRANEMSFLFSVTTAAASAETLQGALDNVAEELLKSLAALSVSIYLPQTYIDAEEKMFTVLQPFALAGSDQPLSELSEVPVDSPQNVLANAAASRRSVIINNIDTELRYLPVTVGARSAIIVPLSSGAQLIGMVVMESTQQNAYDNDTLTLLLTLSGTLSAIIQNQQLLEQVQKTNEQLLELDRLKSDFLANMSHELRTPLNSIIGFSRVILKGIDGPLTEMQEQDLTTIYNSGLHLLNLINDILDQAKISAGKMDLQFDYFEIKAVIDGVRSIGIGLVKDKPIDIFVELAPGLPQVYGDEFRTRQVLLNLVSNAAKFTHEGSITLSVYPVLDEETGRKMVRTDVTDTGIGIVESDIEQLFEAFRQVDSSLTRTAGGTGLGLPIAKSLVEMQGGRVLVTSRVNVGSTFSILMPLEPVDDSAENERKKTDGLAVVPPTTPIAPGNGKNVTGMLTDMGANPAADFHMRNPMHAKRQILIIEDNPDMVDQYRRALGREGFDIFAASIPLEAEAMASGLHPTLIIMDVSFADGAGWDILAKLKSRDDTADIPVIVVTLSQEVARAQEAGAFCFINRPFMPETLVDAVRDAEAESRIDRILIIDDEPESVRLLSQILDQTGQFRIFSANSGMDGIAQVARRRPNLILLDLRMPDMDGFQVIQELRNNPETVTIPIIVVTGDTLDNEERERLNHLNVLYKSEISAESYRLLLDGVTAYLDNGS